MSEPDERRDEPRPEPTTDHADEPGERAQARAPRDRQARTPRRNR